MNEQEILEKLAETFRDIFDIPDLVLNPAMTAEDVPEWDSVNHITLIVATEQQFGIKFQTAEIEELKNVGELVHLVKEKTDNN
ncbi:acyl carrier protein [Telmatospirillum sp.]|uniref:acyl carrier protein n=1 Tax=Telmatospirillum sp. TaxID=2079197 RepID=UPI00284F0D6E|nr:acyl carrier protein [Telmatospirillum sp.]MDR3439932.1 acyl carrier protein [Telmatospirillum sp.]